MRLRVKALLGTIRSKPRPRDYLNLRFHWLHELRQMRAKKRISGTASKKDIKVGQRELARLRREYS